MYSVCLNTALTYRKKSDKAAGVGLNPLHHQIAGEPEDPSDERYAALLAAIATLNPVNKAVILLYLEDMSYDEIAAITGMSRSNVSVRLVRIKKELESKLKDKINTP
jgi:RNA polymerase sigma-70 factor (ECF subfamily)